MPATMQRALRKPILINGFPANKVASLPNSRSVGSAYYSRSIFVFSTKYN